MSRSIASGPGARSIPDLDYYIGLQHICQGIAGRVRDGTATSATAAEQAAMVTPLARAAWDNAKRAGAGD